MKSIQRSASVADDFRRTSGMFEDIANNIQRIADNGDTWEKDNTIDAFKTSKLDSHFSCNCGKNFQPEDGLHRCKCGTTWGSFTIDANDKTGNQSIRIVRTVPEHRERILATRTVGKNIVGRARFAAAAKYADDGGLPSFVRSSGDTAPTVFDQGNDFNNDNSNQDNPQITDGGKPEEGTHKLQSNKTSAGGWPATTTPKIPGQPKPTTQVPATTKPAQKPITQAVPPAASTAPAAAPTAAPQAQPMTAPMQQPVQQQMQQPLPQQTYPNAFGQPVAQQPGYGVTPGVSPFGAPATQQPRTYKKETAMQTYSESEFKQGFLWAEAGEPLPDKKLHRSYLQGYAAYYAPIVADNAPGYDVVGKDFEKPKDGVNNSMSDYTVPSKPMDDPTKDVRNDLSNKIDGDNDAGQSRDNGSMSTDLSGWKSSALLAEIARRTKE